MKRELTRQGDHRQKKRKEKRRKTNDMLTVINIRCPPLIHWDEPGDLAGRQQH